MLFCRSAKRRFVIYRNVAMLLEPSRSWRARVFMGCRRRNLHALPSARFTDIRLENPKSCQHPGHSGKVSSFAEKHVINLQMEYVFFLAKLLLLSDRLSV